MKPNTTLTDAEYEQWGQYICPCDNPYCQPLDRALCIQKVYPHHKAAVKRWLKDSKISEYLKV